ncbi:hypothetical protein [Pseudomonas tohonis]|uniref:hypothetical protein n=1 Tax=Pseudomonas tohonis TaxID=2725477 RepID=UPI0021D9F447|nr:hypothetical protein [Pseudomonas tohonis]UXY55575.1 hypothetical protein N9L84_13695 [Pseudomonas tohonis]
MTDLENQLLGQWHKSSSPACAAKYASSLRFDANGLYSGTPEVPGGFTWWDSGTWHIEGPGRVTLSTANDALVSYGYSLDADGLTFTDPSGCRFSYRREH